MGTLTVLPPSNKPTRIERIRHRVEPWVTHALLWNWVIARISILDSTFFLHPLSSIDHIGNTVLLVMWTLYAVQHAHHHFGRPLAKVVDRLFERLNRDKGPDA